MDAPVGTGAEEGRRGGRGGGGGGGGGGEGKGLERRRGDKRTAVK